MTMRADLIADLGDLAVPGDIEKVGRFFTGGDPDTIVMGIQIGRIFPVAKRHAGLDLAEVDVLLDDNRYEVRMAAMAILDFKARSRKLTQADRRDLFDLYLRKLHRINNWDLVDRAAPHVIGAYLLDRDRTILMDLANSKDPNARRTAIVATYAFIKRGEVADTFRIADILVRDNDAYVQKAVASWIREAGKRDEGALIAFLQRNRGVLPRTTVTAASKHLPEGVRTALKA